MSAFSETSCQYCRTKKVKCDRLLPQCSRCTRLSIDCTYREKLRTGPKRKRLPINTTNTQDIPTLTPNLINVSSISQSTTSSLSSGASASGNHIGLIASKHRDGTIDKISLFDLIPFPAIQTLMQFFLDIETETSSLGFTHQYLAKLLHKGRYLVLSGVLTLASYWNMEYRKYFQNLYDYFIYQCSRMSQSNYKDLEGLQTLALKMMVVIITFNPKEAVSCLCQGSLILQFSNYHIMDLIPSKINNNVSIPDNGLTSEQDQTKDLKRRLYWTIFKMDRYCALGTAMTARLRPEQSAVDLPDSKLNFNHSFKLLFSEDFDVGDIRLARIECQGLTIPEYHYLLLQKAEDIAVWFRKIDFVTSSNQAGLIRNEILTQYVTFNRQFDHFEACSQFTPEQLHSRSYFMSVEFFMICLRSMLKQATIETFATITDITPLEQEIINNIKDELVKLMLPLADRIDLDTIDYYHYNPFFLLMVYEILKILAFHSDCTVAENSEALIGLTNKLVEIITKLAYEYESDLAKRILEDYNTKLQTSLIHSFFYMEGLAKDKSTVFQDFLSAEIYS